MCNIMQKHIILKLNRVRIEPNCTEGYSVHLLKIFYAKSVDWRLTKSSAKIKIICGSGRLFFLWSVDVFIFDDTLLALTLEIIQIEISTTEASSIVLAVIVSCCCFCRRCLYIISFLFVCKFIRLDLYSIVFSFSVSTKNTWKNSHEHLINKILS